MDLIVGEMYRRPELHKMYGGNVQSGISQPKDGDVVLLFSYLHGNRHGYEDRQLENGNFLYYGEGKVGDQRFVRGNLQIRDHVANGRRLLLFREVSAPQMRFLGEYRYLKHVWDHENIDDNDQVRSAIQFHLAPASVKTSAESTHPEVKIEEIAPESVAIKPDFLDLFASNYLKGKDDQELLDIAMDRTPLRVTETTVVRRIRSEAVRQFVLRRADGKCECCTEDAPFDRPDGSPYLEPHHTTRLADGGPDDPRHVIALCPNCHREIHYGRDGDEKNKELMDILAYLHS